jgi:hypothetical protein
VRLQDGLSFIAAVKVRERISVTGAGEKYQKSIEGSEEGGERFSPCHWIMLVMKRQATIRLSSTPGSMSGEDPKIDLVILLRIL